MRQSIIVAFVIAHGHCDRRSLGNYHRRTRSETGSRVGSEFDRCAADDEGRAEPSRGKIRRALS